MPRPLGTSKTGGRRKGTPNRRTIDLTERLENVGLNVPERLVELLPQLSAEKQVEILMDLMTFLYPKRKAIEVSESEEAPKITISFIESDGQGGVKSIESAV